MENDTRLIPGIEGAKEARDLLATNIVKLIANFEKESGLKVTRLKLNKKTPGSIIIRVEL